MITVKQLITEVKDIYALIKIDDSKATEEQLNKYFQNGNYCNKLESCKFSFSFQALLLFQKFISESIVLLKDQFDNDFEIYEWDLIDEQVFYELEENMPAFEDFYITNYSIFKQVFNEIINCFNPETIIKAKAQKKKTRALKRKEIEDFISLSPDKVLEKLRPNINIKDLTLQEKINLLEVHLTEEHDRIFKQLQNINVSLQQFNLLYREEPEKEPKISKYRPPTKYYNAKVGTIPYRITLRYNYKLVTGKRIDFRYADRGYSQGVWLSGIIDQIKHGFSEGGYLYITLM